MTDTDTKERPETKAPEKSLSPRRMELVEIERPAYRISVGQDITLQDLVTSSYWVHHMKRFKGGEIIEVVCEDMTWSADLLVRHKMVGGVVMGVQRFTAFTVEAEAKGKINKMKAAHDLKEARASDKSPYVTKFVGGKWMVRENRIGAGWIGEDGHPTEEAARLWMRNQEKALAR